MTGRKELRAFGVIFLAELAWVLSGVAIMFWINPAVGFLFFLGSFPVAIRLLGDLVGWLDRN